MYRFPYRGLLLVMAIVVMGGCGDNSFLPSTQTDPITVTDTVEGTLTKESGRTHLLTALSLGPVTVTLTTLSPDSTLVVGISVGIWTGNACSASLSNDSATQGTTMAGNVSGGGTLCVRVYDVGNLTQTQTYVLTVVHP